ncbi:alpha-2-macroglobulin-P-like [Amphiura filiformis]|uniref:alpha-2-macroglobulin-P-like n=1 Tax=Amphiura filiformis TaxID=82378 RepID=UPI003B20EFDC
MVGVEGLCSNARRGEFVTEEGVVEAGQAKSFSFIVIPVEIQDYVITIYMFSAYGLHDNANQNQIDTVRLIMPDNVIQITAKCEVNLIGINLGPVASAVIEGLNIGEFLPIPSGDGETTMMYTATNVYIYQYLKAIDKDTAYIEMKAIQNIEDGYSREVNNFRTPDGAFKTFSTTPANSWLTSFVLRVLCKAKEDITVDRRVICEGMAWLSNIQQADGSFGFTYRTYQGANFMV